MNSLEILSPKPDPEAATILPKSATAIYLENLQVHLVECLNQRNWSHPDLETFVAVNFQAWMEHMDKPIVTTRDGFIERYKHLCASHPDYTYDVEQIEATVDERKDSAVVWYVMNIWGHPTGVHRKSVTVNTWERNKGRWLCIKQTGVRGIGYDV